jgi:hypothetical protein
VTSVLSDSNENLRDNFVYTLQIGPANADDVPPGELEEASSALFSLDVVVYFLNAVAILDASIELDGDFQTGDCDINEEGVPVAADFLLSGDSLDSGQDQRVENSRFSRGLTSGICAGNNPSSLTPAVARTGE